MSEQRLTPAQLRGLRLLAHPDAVARKAPSIRWRVLASDDSEIGSIHSETLLHLRDAGLVLRERGPGGVLDVRQRITEAGRAYLEAIR